MKEKTFKGDDGVERTGQQWFDFIHATMLEPFVGDELTKISQQFSLYTHLALSEKSASENMALSKDKRDQERQDAKSHLDNAVKLAADFVKKSIESAMELKTVNIEKKKGQIINDMERLGKSLEREVVYSKLRNQMGMMLQMHLREMKCFPKTRSELRAYIKQKTGKNPFPTSKQMGRHLKSFLLAGKIEDKRGRKND